MERHEEVTRSKKHIFINNFIGGIAWGIGATIGLAILFAVLGVVLANVNLIPIVGSFVSETIKFVLQNNPELIRQ